jgi:hypothetical protein
LENPVVCCGELLFQGAATSARMKLNRPKVNEIALIYDHLNGESATNLFFK